MQFVTLTDDDKYEALEKQLRADETQYYIALIFTGQHNEPVRESIERAQGELLRLRSQGNVVESGPVTLRPADG